MLYRVFKVLFFLTTKAYFRTITIAGKGNLPSSDTPVIFAANHPSAFMDPIILGAILKRSLYFLARGDVFENKLVRPIFQQLHMIPVYKSDESPNQMHKNASTFEKCFDHLGLNNTILIFPEGTSKTERRLRPIKTGTARIAFGAEEKHNFKLGLTIVPIGLNYSNPHFFKSDVLVNYGSPIVVSDYKQAFENDPRQAVLQLTDRIKAGLENEIVVIEDEQLEKTIEHIESLYRSTLRHDDSMEDKGTQDFKLSQDIVKAVEHFAIHEPKALSVFAKKIRNYNLELKQAQIRDTQIRSASVRFNLLRRLIYFIIGFPVFLFGYVSNYIPFVLTRFLAKKIKIREDFVGAVNIALGLIIFLIVYGIQSAIVANYTNAVIGIVFFVMLYPTGFFAIEYIKTYYKFRVTIKYLSLFIRKSDLVAGLKSKRQDLINELEQRKEQFLKLRDE